MPPGKLQLALTATSRLNNLLHVSGIDPVTFRQRLLRWFSRHKRDLPWRLEPRDPYHVWVAEIMLQQTQVATVIPYYERWIKRFPTLDSLVTAHPDEVLKLWEGLGYYSRARNLHRAALIIAGQYQGKVPANTQALMELPGIGRYTAGAIASLAYECDAPVVDGNVARVLIRSFAIKGTAKSPEVVKKLWNVSELLLAPGRARAFNEALMDLGAIICLPVKPKCDKCPLVSLCNAYAKSAVDRYPAKSAKRQVPHKDFATLVAISKNNSVLLAQRRSPGLFGGLWEFPGGELQLDSRWHQRKDSDYHLACKQLSEIILQQAGVHVAIKDSDFVGIHKHSLTHFHMTRHIALVFMRPALKPLPTSDLYARIEWVKWDDLRNLALTRSDQHIAGLIAAQLPGLPQTGSTPGY
jgi:A/G-specific adenine glycosylase